MNIIRVAFFLAYRGITKSSIGSTLLIISIMTMTFLNLVVVGGILVGLTAGISGQIRTYYSSDVIIEPASGRSFILKSADIINDIKQNPNVVNYSARYIGNGRIEANFNKPIRADEEIDSTSAPLVGINPEQEDDIANISKLIVEGEFLTASDRGAVVLGSNLLFKYAKDPNTLNNTIGDVQIGDNLRLQVNGQVVDVKLKGILKSKVDKLSQRIYMTEHDVRNYLGRDDLNRGEIVIKLRDGYSPNDMKQYLLNKGYGYKNSIKTWNESLGSFFEDIAVTFSTLGNFVGSIGLFIASITIFIIIYVNAINRRKYIGIMKAIGVQNEVIELSYIFQSLFYSISGAGIGLCILFFGLVPFFKSHPIDFPFSDGILAASVVGSFTRAFILVVFSVIAALIPARMIVKQNTIDAILDR